MTEDETKTNDKEESSEESEKKESDEADSGKRDHTTR